jgi:site-specific DNA recombinase
VLCHAPDRLARRYAYQVLVLEELARGGIEVVFAKEPERSGSPEDELLRQFQGMIAEYERAQIAERCRRGKLHRARAGAVSVLSNAPYGYRYVKRTEHADAFYEIDELEAPIVREIFDRYVERRESIVQIGRALSAQGVPTRTGTPHWGSSTIWAILRNPAYIGQAAYGRRRVTGEPAKPMRLTRQRGRHSGRSAYEHVGPELWLRIPVPALISEEQHALAQELLERNRRLSPRNTRKPSLLQGILVCRECGHSYYRSSTRSKTGNVHHYYRCSGADSFRRPEGRVCAARPVRINEVDEPVWARVLTLLENPDLIKAEIDRRLQALRSEHPATRRRDGLQRDLTRAQNALRRLIDGYQEQLITLEELRARMPELRRREATLRAELDALDTDLHDAETYLKLTETLDAFRDYDQRTVPASTFTGYIHFKDPSVTLVNPPAPNPQPVPVSQPTVTQTQTVTTGTTPSPTPPPAPAPTWAETAGGAAHTWTNYTNAGGTQGPSIAGGQAVAIACKVTGFRVSDGNTWWYRIASAPWSNAYYMSADAFYNNGQTSGSLVGTPWVDPAVANC